MDEIERTVSLPQGAFPLNDYARYYAAQSDGKVAVLYVVHSASHFDEMRDICSREPADVFPCNASGKSMLVPPGNRLWLDDSQDLPSMDGGGCANIQFTYDPAGKARMAPRCNGSY